jgi:hypothetical protein
LNNNNCAVNGVNVIDQNDAKITPWLYGYVRTRYAPGGQPVKWAEPELYPAPAAPPPPTPMSVPQFVSNIEGYGCYISTLTMMETAALANLPARTPVSGRARLFADLATDDTPLTQPFPKRGVSAADIVPQSNTDRVAKLSVEERRLLWQYERWADKLQPNPANPLKSSEPDFLQGPEFAAGIAGASYHDVFYPELGQLGNLKLMQLLSAGHYLGLAYTRKTIGHDGTNVTLTAKSQHKVFVSGFQKAYSYPILIGDVGNGQPVLTRVAPLSDLTFLSADKKTKLTLPPNLAKYVALVYQGYDDPYVENGNKEVYVVEQMLDLTAPIRSN